MKSSIILLNIQACQHYYDHILRTNNFFVFFYYIKGATLDTLARSKLWEQGLDYAHGTGHAIGSFLGVHESKWRITLHILTNISPTLDSWRYQFQRISIIWASGKQGRSLWIGWKSPNSVCDVSVMSLTDFLLRGKHFFPKNSLKWEWDALSWYRWNKQSCCLSNIKQIISRRNTIKCIYSIIYYVIKYYQVYNIFLLDWHIAKLMFC